MWLLRNGHVIRVDMYTDPCWSNSDIWKARNLFCRFRSMGYTENESTSMASALIWKQKWTGLSYCRRVEKTLKNATMISESEISSLA